jgi:hypothetical protein
MPAPVHHGPMPQHNLMPQGPIQTAPMPTPINPSMHGFPATMMPYGYGMVRPVTYQQGYYGYPQYQLPGYNPWVPAPSYWYGQ